MWKNLTLTILASCSSVSFAQSIEDDLRYLYLETRKLAVEYQNEKRTVYERLDQRLREFNRKELANLVVHYRMRIKKFHEELSPNSPSMIIGNPDKSLQSIFLSAPDEAAAKFSAGIKKLEQQFPSLMQSKDRKLTGAGYKVMTEALQSVQHIGENARLRMLGYIGEVLQAEGRTEQAKDFQYRTGLIHSPGKDGYYAPETRLRIAAKLRSLLRSKLSVAALATAAAVTAVTAGSANAEPSSTVGTSSPTQLQNYGDDDFGPAGSMD